MKFFLQLWFMAWGNVFFTHKYYPCWVFLTLNILKSQLVSGPILEETKKCLSYTVQWLSDTPKCYAILSPVENPKFQGFPPWPPLGGLTVLPYPNAETALSISSCPLYLKSISKLAILPTVQWGLYII